MKIQSKIRGDMIGCNLKHNPDNGARFALVKISVGVNRDRCRSIFGEVLERVAFGSLVETGGNEKTPAAVSFGYKTITPDIQCEYHEIQILGHTQSMQPVIKAVRPVKDKAEVVVDIEFPILIKKDKAIAGAIATEFGEVIGIDLEPAQRELNLVEGGNSGNPSVVVKKGAFGNPEPVAAG
ncbi:hypothetical protein LCGC14_2191450 [marine sediment metagenome]|uniref:Uncharacterized protein n=1 Tax=marine sediment metagenome TaxID=412755 RepID=A0A0F9E6I9_9ZZZZ